MTTILTTAEQMRANQNETLTRAFTELTTSFVGDGINQPINYCVTAELKFDDIHYERAFVELGTEIGRTLAWQMPEAVLGHNPHPGASSVYYIFRFRWSNQDLLERMRISAAMIRQNSNTVLGLEDIG